MVRFYQTNNQDSSDAVSFGSLDEARIEKHLMTKEIGRSIKLFDSIDSTNKKAKEMAANRAVHGSVVVADEQIDGKGRLGRAWISKKGTGIWMSIILRPEFAPAHASKLTVISALAVSQAVYGLIGQRLLVKWPNDLVMHGSKICGILTELRADKQKIDYAIVGIGINVSTHREEFPPELADTASSIILETGYQVDKNMLIARILSSFEELYYQFAITGDFSHHRAIYRDLSATLDNRVRVIGAREEFEGVAVDLTDNCTLLVRQDDGRIKEVLAGDVSIRGIAGYI